MSAVDPRVSQKVRRGRLVACDPGLLKPAAAKFVDGCLVRAQRIKIPGALSKLPLGERTRLIARLIAEWAVEDGRVDHFVWELPKVYTDGKSDPADLIAIALVGASVAGYLDVETYAPLAGEWSGGTPKVTSGTPWESPRGKLLIERLAMFSHDRALVQDTHDAIDACAIGMWYLGYMGRVYPQKKPAMR